MLILVPLTAAAGTGGKFTLRARSVAIPSLRIMGENPPDHVRCHEGRAAGERVVRPARCRGRNIATRASGAGMPCRRLPSRRPVCREYRRVLGRIVAPVDARQHKVRGDVEHDIVQSGQNAIRRAAFGGKAAFAHFASTIIRVGVADAVTSAGLFERGGDRPDLTIGPGQFAGDLREHLRAPAQLIPSSLRHESAQLPACVCP